MLKKFKYLTGILDKKDQKTWKLYAALSLISPIVDVFSFSMVIYIINLAVQQHISPQLIAFTLCMMLLSILKAVFELYKNKSSNRFIYTGAQKLSMKLYELMMKEDLVKHSQKSPMQALNIIRNDTASCIQIIIDVIGIAVDAIAMAGYGAALIYVSKWMGVVTSILLILLMLLMYVRIRGQMLRYGDRAREWSIKANAQVTIAYGSFKEMKIDDRSDFILNKYEYASNEYAKVYGKFRYKISSINVILQNSIMAVLFAMLALIMVFGTNPAAVLAPMVVYVTALVRMLPMAYTLLSSMNNIEFAQKAYDELKASMDRYEAMKEEERRTEGLRKKTLTFERGVSVKNLTFGYTKGSPVFQDASIEIPVGCSIAIIGISGSGKTTFVDLLLGLLKPESGSILYDDYDIVAQRDEEGPCQVSMGQAVSYIPQTIFLNGETVRNNVAFFEEEEEIDDARVEECLKCAQIWQDVQQMPQGVDTLIGENGTAISGGQRQRIALARALYKDFELLVMDEATAALDMETEKAVIDSIRQIKGSKTLLLVTHHMSLADECDVVYKIEDKKIIQVRRGHRENCEEKPPQHVPKERSGKP